MKDLITYAKANPNKITFGSNGEGGFPHMTIELLRVMGGFTYVHVPYKGSAQIATDLIGGHVDAAIDGITGLTPHIRSGKLRLLAITNPARVPQFDGTPAIAETLPGYDSRGWFGFLAPAGTPREIVTLMNQEINRAMSLPDVKEKLVVGRTHHRHRTAGVFRRGDQERLREIRQAHPRHRFPAGGQG